MRGLRGDAFGRQVDMAWLGPDNTFGELDLTPELLLLFSLGFRDQIRRSMVSFNALEGGESVLVAGLHSHFTYRVVPDHLPLMNKFTTIVPIRAM